MEADKTNPVIEKGTSRIASFSDGVFAIAITLLILDIKVPGLNNSKPLIASLLDEWPGFLALLIGFSVILICWINHHYMFELIQRSNGTLLVLNGFKLLVVTVTPIATAILSKYINTPECGTAVSIFCFNFALMGSAMAAMWCYASAQGFVKASPAVLRASTLLYIFAAVLSASIWLISFYSIIASLVLSGIMFSVFLLPERTTRWLVNRSEARLSRREV